MRCVLVLALLCAGCETSGARAQTARERTFELGYHLGTWLGNGEPANDIPVSASLYGRTRIDDGWWIRGGVDLAQGDFETPHELLGITQDPSVDDLDADSEYFAMMAWAERVHTIGERSEVFWQVGAGVSSVDVDGVSGPVRGGGTFDIETDAGTEYLLSAGAGYRWLWTNWRLEALARYDYHFADWEITDRVSGASSELDDYGTFALLVGFGYAF